MIHFIMVSSDIHGNVNDCCWIRYIVGKRAIGGGRLSHKVGGLSHRDLYDT